MRIAVLGGGAFGVALASALKRAGRDPTLVCRDARGAALVARGEPAPRAPHVKPEPGLRATTGRRVLETADAILVAVPAQQARAAIASLPAGPGALVLTAKGVERDTLALPSQVAAEAAPGRSRATLSGPGFADEIAAGAPTALTLACSDSALGAALQEALATPALRLYLSDDPVGAETGGAVKNVIAIACGAAEGLGLGESARAALITRGFAELRRLAVALGGHAETVTGLSGLGDLALTCGSARSRNFRYGRALASGARSEDLAEGALGAQAAAALARRARIEAPIIDVVAALVAGTMDARGATTSLLARPLRTEREDLR